MKSSLGYLTALSRATDKVLKQKLIAMFIHSSLNDPISQQCALSTSCVQETNQRDYRENLE